MQSPSTTTKKEHQDVEVEVEELMSVMSELSIPNSPKRKLFNRFDIEKSGYLNKKQFGSMMTHMGMVTNPDTDDDVLVEAEMAMIANEEGKVLYKDWTAWYKEQ